MDNYFVHHIKSSINCTHQFHIQSIYLSDESDIIRQFFDTSKSANNLA